MTKRQKLMYAISDATADCKRPENEYERELSKLRLYLARNALTNYDSLHKGETP